VILSPTEALHFVFSEVLVRLPGFEKSIPRRRHTRKKTSSVTPTKRMT